MSLSLTQRTKVLYIRVRTDNTTGGPFFLHAAESTSIAAHRNFRTDDSTVFSYFFFYAAPFLSLSLSLSRSSLFPLRREILVTSRRESGGVGGGGGPLAGEF